MRASHLCGVIVLAPSLSLSHTHTAKSPRASRRRAPGGDEEPAVRRRERRHRLARLARGQVEVPRDRRLAEDGAEPRLDDGAAPSAAPTAKRSPTTASAVPPAAAVDTQAASSTTRPPSRPSRRDAQRAVAVEHAERAVARAEGRADDVAGRCDGRAATSTVSTRPLVVPATRWRGEPWSSVRATAQARSRRASRLPRASPFLGRLSWSAVRATAPSAVCLTMVQPSTAVRTRSPCRNVLNLFVLYCFLRHRSSPR